MIRNQSHPSALETAIPPASGLKCGPEITGETTLAGLAMIQEKTVNARKTIIVKIMDDRDFPLQSLAINHRRHDREDVVDLPKIKPARFLVMTQLRQNIGIIGRFPGYLQLRPDAGSGCFGCGIEKVFHVMDFLQRLAGED